jgi:hypothetical protein
VAEVLHIDTQVGGNSLTCEKKDIP